MIVKPKRTCAVDNIKHDVPNPVQTGEPALLRNKLADDVDLILQPVHKVAATLGDFSPQAPARPGEFPVFSIKLITERSSITTLVLHEFQGRHFEPHSQWGINE